jgi:hypothetical protein
MNHARSLLARFGIAGASLAGLLALVLSQTPALATPPPAPAAGYGTIKGRLVWGGASAPKPTVITQNKTKDPQICAKETLYDRSLIVDAETKGIANAFAYLPNPKGENPERAKELVSKEPVVVIDQVNCEYIPFSTAAYKGQKIEFKSSDPIGHNVHYQGFINTANFALGPKGSATKDLKAEKRPINLTCDIHPWMNGNIMVLDHPFFAVTGKDGSFEIKGVPAGTQNIIVWQRKAGYVTSGRSRGMAVEVKPDAVTDLGEIVLDPSSVK